MDGQSLTDYVVGRIRAGVSKAELKEELSSLGWTEEEIESGYRSAVIALGAPVPNTGNRATQSRKAGTVDVVINFFSFILLGIVATALGTLFFGIINHYLPDALDAANWYSASQTTSSIHYSIAALLIGFPMYFFAMRLWFRKFREDEGRMESKLSKWLTYLVLLVAAVTVVGDLIAIVFAMLQGEVTTRFFLKALVILGIAGAIFGFYYLERRKIQYRTDISRTTFQYFGRVVSLVVALGILLGFFAGGSPATQRSITLDQTRAGHLSSLAGCIEQYALSLGTLPMSLGDLKQSNQYSYCLGYMKDPETGSMYEYRVITPAKIQGAAQVGEYELCATFALSATDTPETQGYYGQTGIWYTHDAGRVCQTVTAQIAAPSIPGTMLTK